MKYVLSIMKYVSLATLMFNTCLIVYYFFFGDVLYTVISIVLEICLFIETYIFNSYAENTWADE